MDVKCDLDLLYDFPKFARMCAFLVRKDFSAIRRCRRAPYL